MVVQVAHVDRLLYKCSSGHDQRGLEGALASRRVAILGRGSAGCPSGPQSGRVNHADRQIVDTLTLRFCFSSRYLPEWGTSAPWLHLGNHRDPTWFKTV